MLTGPGTPRRRAVFLGIGFVLMLAAAWTVAPVAGPIIAASAAFFGWMACWVMLPAAPPAVDRAAMSTLRHDLRGILSPALLMADRLMSHPDEQVRHAGDVVSRSVERATERLAEAE